MTTGFSGFNVSADLQIPQWLTVSDSEYCECCAALLTRVFGVFVSALTLHSLFERLCHSDERWTDHVTNWSVWSTYSLWAAVNVCIRHRAWGFIQPLAACFNQSFMNKQKQTYCGVQKLWEMWETRAKKQLTNVWHLKRKHDWKSKWIDTGWKCWGLACEGCVQRLYNLFFDFRVDD